MKKLNGVRIMSLESMAVKESIPALQYASEVIAEEVDSQFAIEDFSKVSKQFSPVKAKVIEFLNKYCDIPFWSAVLGHAGLEAATKKEAEVFLNAYSTLMVMPVVFGLMVQCSLASGTHSCRRKMEAVLKELEQMRFTAVDLLENHGYTSQAPDLWSGFLIYAREDVEKLWADLAA